MVVLFSLCEINSVQVSFKAYMVSLGLMVSFLISGNGISQTSYLPQTGDLEKLSGFLLNPEVPDSVRIESSLAFSKALVHLLSGPSGWNVDLSALNQVSVLTAPEKQFKLYTWFSVEQYRHKANGIIQIKEKEGIKLVVLKESYEEATGNRKLGYEQWPGALYYDIASFGSGKEKSWLLLGFHPGDGTVHRKVIEVLQFDGRGSPRFGFPSIVLENNKKVNRLVFQFSGKARMGLSFERGKRQVRFDHLSPAENSLKGHYQHYGPDFSIDGLVYRSGKWVYLSDIDAMNKTENLGREGVLYRAPSKPTQTSKREGNKAR